MSRSIGFNICVVTCCILLLSSRPPCLASPLPEESDMTKVQQDLWAGNGVEDEWTSMPDLNNLGPEQTVSEEPAGVSAKPSGMPLDEAFTAGGETRPVSPSHVFLSSQSLGVSTPAGKVAAEEEKELSPTKSELDENGEFKAMLTTAVTTLNPSVQEESVSGLVSKATTEDCEVGQGSASLLASPLSVTAAAEEGTAESSLHPSAAPQPHSERVPTLHPGTPSLETVGDHFIPTPQASSASSEVGALKTSTGSTLRLLSARGTIAASHPLVTTEASVHLEADVGAGQGELPTTASTITGHPTGSMLPDWDDTKPGNISQGGSMLYEEVEEDRVAMEASQTPLGSEEEDVMRVVPSPASAPPTPGLAKESNCTAPAVRGDGVLLTSTASSDVPLTVDLPGVDTAGLNSLENINVVTAEEKSIPPSQPEAVVMTDASDLSSTLESSLKGATQEVTTAAQEADAALSVVTLAPTAPQGTGASSLPQETSGEDTQMSAAPGATQMLTAAGSSTAKPPDVEDFADVILVTSEKAASAPGGLSATQPGQTEEPSSRTVVLVTPASVASSVRRTALPAVRKISTAVTYGLDRLESEEGEEEEEDEEEEEEEEEEEDEEDKDIDSMDESLEGDTELPGFTLPGETSQEPIAGLENPAAQLAGVSYQVPDTIEWEQQNQGLVRSWMEKLKDKAGYMSGMLVPVGVGIAGALFILGALYSIKIMNRRRRNGSKRHKRKREFNSMQDRVMLLADSSEDEF
ncbi:armadillo-like helical domain-containing protein 4 [Cygnus atratus]|uniref:armadillo-like helical domain-containing protein 4 n=1 Tax=Cygnus atratus TaxID=8868 RepID=UPI0015D63DA5|nr:armadillo-like helical domain-containing protein 4 [Cygnus atratus]